MRLGTHSRNGKRSERTKIIAKIEKAIAVIDEDIEKLDQDMVEAENDYGKLAEIQKLRDAKVTKQEAYFAEYMRLEEVIETVESIRNAVKCSGVEDKVEDVHTRRIATTIE